MQWSGTILKRISDILDKYGIVIAGVIIFAYYLWATLDWFGTSIGRRGFQGYFFQFDSLILLWLLLVAGMKLHQYRKKEKEENENLRRIALEHELQKMRAKLLDDVTTMLSDAINNPLAVISLSTGSIRERFSSDIEIMAFVDRIEGALKRMQEVLTQFQHYQSRQILFPSHNFSADSMESQKAVTATAPNRDDGQATLRISNRPGDSK